MFIPQNTHHLPAHPRISQSLTLPHLWVHMYLILLQNPCYLLFPWGVTRLLFPSSFTPTILGYRQKQNHKSPIHVMNSRKNEKHLFLQLLDLCSLVRDEISLKLRQIEDPNEDVKSFTTWIILWFYVNLSCAGAGKRWSSGSQAAAVGKVMLTFFGQIRQFQCHCIRWKVHWTRKVPAETRSPKRTSIFWFNSVISLNNSKFT